MMIILVDDDRMNNLIMSEALKGVSEGEARAFTDPLKALAALHGQSERVGVIVVDYEMPGMNGVELIKAVRASPGYEAVPIVMVTSMTARCLRHEALEAGATEFLNKPCDPVEVRTRVHNLLKLRKLLRAEQDRSAWLSREVAAAVETIEAREREIVAALMRAAECRDSDTGDHIERVATYVTFIAEALGFNPEACRMLSLASTMHDVGKIGVPDAILLKNGPLTEAERAEMQLHTERGYAILGSSNSEVLKIAAEIARSHHERWDGTGYPLGLSGGAIPLGGRIVAVADVFDALTSARPYKTAWSLDAARAHLVANAGRHFDPACVDAFLTRWQDIACFAKDAF
ncbi:response regulator [Methylobacterium organophilum]|uniref:response regulator n=1 Tax=Methylobacterium organophilum TaxID=410 RepID=UPI001F144C21|nr:HD domain-containing phosphohydrolase [Methylobacterium organophilum]UMY18944.1 response regulator [Methylobacterium organophilum]